MDSIYLILLISVLGPVIGSFIGVMKKPSESFMYIMLSFAAGIMLAISFLELIPKSIELSSIWLSSVGIIIGSVVMYGLDKLIPHIHPELCKPESGIKLKFEKTSIYLMAGIFLHNLPEGMAIATGIVSSFGITLGLALAIAIHNIPEAICTSAPYYYLTKNRLKSFLLASSTAIPIILGFFIARFLFQNIPTEIIGMIIAATAGLMIYISCDELIPTSCNKDDDSWTHGTIFALIAGVLFVILLGLI
ncbi:MAG: ZIP family metal transporter [DPANN group archaeon]|nr:ZIP family metal transporter [DPANN group archaeon]